MNQNLELFSRMFWFGKVVCKLKLTLSGERFKKILEIKFLRSLTTDRACYVTDKWRKNTVISRNKQNNSETFQKSGSEDSLDDVQKCKTGIVEIAFHFTR